MFGFLASVVVDRGENVEENPSLQYTEIMSSDADMLSLGCFLTYPEVVVEMAIDYIDRELGWGYTLCTSAYRW